MLSEFLTFLFTFSCLFLILIIMLQRGKGSMGLGSMGGGTQMLFGGSGGQDLFQKITWMLGAIIIFGSLGLSLYKVQQQQTSQYTGGYKAPIKSGQRS